MKKVLLCACATAITLIMSCGSAKTTADVAALNGEWSIMEIGTTKVDTANCEQAPFIGFNAKDKQIYGSTGCNLLTGALNADVNKGMIDFSQTGSTRMLCADMETERLVLDALYKSKSFKIDGTDKMIISDRGGNTTLVLKKRN